MLFATFLFKSYVWDKCVFWNMDFKMLSTNQIAGYSNLEQKQWNSVIFYILMQSDESLSLFKKITGLWFAMGDQYPGWHHGPLWSEDFKIGCIAVMNWCNKLIFVFTNSGKITFILTHFQPMFLFYTPWKHQETGNWKIGWKWVNNFRVLIVKDGCSHIDYRALKSTVYQEWMN